MSAFGRADSADDFLFTQVADLFFDGAFHNSKPDRNFRNRYLRIHLKQLQDFSSRSADIFPLSLGRLPEG